MSSMDGLRSQLAEVREALRDVVGRLDALEQKAVTAEIAPAITISAPDTKPQNVVKSSMGAGPTVTRKP